MPRRIQKAEDFGRVALMIGGQAAEREISLISGAAVLASLEKQQVQVEAVDVQSNAIDALAGKQFDRAFNIIHGRGGEDGVLQAILDAKGIPYTGSGVLASALAMDKLRTKMCWQGMGLSTPPWFVLKTTDDLSACAEALGFPVIVKPALEGSSFGMSKANDKAELAEAWALARQYGCEVYAEKWVSGKEYTVGFLQGEALPVIRLQTPHAFYDYAAKYQADNTQYHCPSGLDAVQEAYLQKLAVQACEVIGVTGWGRVDVFIDSDDKAQLIEVNTVPGMTSHSLVPMAAKATGIDFDELVWRILETSFGRNYSAQ
ncbi:D-alanine--D-alanine ligase [methane-oxidizing endosymbiont of Gigantopelta aegis]|uniref:D-alanine--D-alanine ligase n=1 Tax=methane-oxidizing endosymbiont of Gigantopelta aegis TaxID=2794938 RepID=UPI0018DE4E13|nr:D-alanine--D-alanine ligase [methane-oxidizing endosymbiont of Gigantopelta aegis]